MTDIELKAREAHDRRQRKVLVGIAMMFFAPLAVCFFLYYGRADWHPGGRVNTGDLVTPPQPLPSLALPRMDAGLTDPNFLKGKWTFLYVTSGPCADACLTRLYDTRQVRTALDRDMNRVQRVFIAEANCCSSKFMHDQHPDLITLRSDASAISLLALLPGLQARTASVAPSGREPSASSTPDGPRVYLIDPLGNLMMSYGPKAKAKGMLEDMKRLLRLSSIG
jgi:hypothetical protein